MPKHFVRRAGALALLGGVLIALPACGDKGKGKPELARGQTIRGKVTYNGKPVPYGAVLLFNHGYNVDSKTGKFYPTAFAAIGPDGTYEMTNAAVGPVMVC